MGGMLLGTLIGVLVIPGLYYIFAKMADGKNLIKDEHDEPMSEEFFRQNDTVFRLKARLRLLNQRMKKMTNKTGNKN